MIPPLVFVGGIAAVLFLKSRRTTFGAKSLAGYALGEGPYDVFPDGTDDVVTSINQVKASSGNPYTVHEFKRGNNQRYYLAVRSDASLDWIGYLFDPITKQRVAFRGNAENEAGEAQLKKDFGV